MDPSTFIHLKDLVQVSAVVLSFVINLFLIYLILTKSTKKMGNYKHLMVFFCSCSLFFSTMDVIIRPVIHSHRSAFFMIMDLRHRNISVQVGNIMVCGMAGCFGVIIYGIAIHFIFRYFALERNGRTKYFANRFLPLWFVIPVLGGISWTLVSLILFPMTSTSSEYIGPAIKSAFNMDVNQSAYAAAIFYQPNEKGKLEFNWPCGLGLFFYLLIMAIPFSIVIYVGIKSYEKIKEFPVSKYGKGLQMQLYKALIAQTLIPVLFLFLPFGVIFLCPILEIECKVLSTSLTFVYALYPVVDPLPIYFFIESYRNAMSKMFSCQLCTSSKIYTISDEVQSREANSL